MNGLIDKIPHVILGFVLLGCSGEVKQNPPAEPGEQMAFHLSQQEPDYSLIENGHLVIVGGAMRDSLIFAKFLELAGGEDARIVVIPTAAADSLSAERLESSRIWATEKGVKNVTILHTKDRSEANSEEFVKPILEATGVWFTGGRQWRIADSFLDTRTHEEIENLLRRGGVVGGSSAGATIQGTYLARGDTEGNRTMMGDHEEGMNFFPNTAIDQHLLKRNRQFDLIEIIERYPELLGIGLDENTAIVVHGDTFRVMGSGYVAIFDSRLWGQKVMANQGKFFLLSRGDVYNFKTRKVVSWSSRGREVEALTAP